MDYKAKVKHHLEKAKHHREKAKEHREMAKNEHKEKKEHKKRNINNFHSGLIDSNVNSIPFKEANFINL